MYQKIWKSIRDKNVTYPMVTVIPYIRVKAMQMNSVTARIQVQNLMYNK